MYYCIVKFKLNIFNVVIVIPK